MGLEIILFCSAEIYLWILYFILSRTHPRGRVIWWSTIKTHKACTVWQNRLGCRVKEREREINTDRRVCSAINNVIPLFHNKIRTIIFLINVGLWGVCPKQRSDKAPLGKGRDDKVRGQKPERDNGMESYPVRSPLSVHIPIRIYLIFAIYTYETIS